MTTVFDQRKPSYESEPLCSRSLYHVEIQKLREMGYQVTASDDESESICVTREGKAVVLGVGQSLQDLVSGRTDFQRLWADHRLNSCAIAAFRDTADGDYITARLAFREECYEQFLWSAEQAIEKYLKCILVLRRIPRPKRDIGHDLLRAIELIGEQVLQLTKPTEELIKHLQRTAIGARYFEVATVAQGDELVVVDRAVWELRRFCTPTNEFSTVALTAGQLPPRIRLCGGRLEKVIDTPKCPGREALLWQNAFFGRRSRRRVRPPRWGLSCKNAPLYVMPDVASEFAKYARIPHDAVTAYEELAKARKAQAVASPSIRKGAPD